MRSRGRCGSHAEEVSHPRGPNSTSLTSCRSFTPPLSRLQTSSLNKKDGRFDQHRTRRLPAAPKELRRLCLRGRFKEDRKIGNHDCDKFGLPTGYRFAENV